MLGSATSVWFWFMSAKHYWIGWENLTCSSNPSSVECPTPYKTGGSLASARLSSFPLVRDCHLDPVLLCTWPWFAAKVYNLAELGKHPCNNDILVILWPILLKAIPSTTGKHLLLRNLCLIWPWRLHLAGCWYASVFLKRNGDSWLSQQLDLTLSTLAPYLLYKQALLQN